ncbi:NAD(P)H-dependent oxidoreductase [Novosphingobium fluoreni]|uniref:NAD(P)H-dependent oxidoreductase n=1 Tax=Novosphingobium fluoreni TaxID=1391222 RepID=UPI003DA19CEA
MSIPPPHDPGNHGFDAEPRILVVTAHPAGASLTRAIATTIMQAAEINGCGTEVADLVAEGFDPVFGPADHAAFALGGVTPEDVRTEQRRIDRSDHLVLVYPVYWWAMPALLKGWIDRVFIAGWAFDEDADGDIAKRLDRLSISLVAVAGATRATYDRRGYREAMRVQIETGIFDFCGAPVVSSQLVTPDRMAEPSALDDIARTTLAQIVAR